MRIVLEVATDRSPADLPAAIRHLFKEQHQVKLEALMALHRRPDPDEEERQSLVSDLKLLDALRDGSVVSILEG